MFRNYELESKIQNLKSKIGWMKGLRTFRARIFWSFIPIIVLLVVVLGVIDFREQRRLAEEEFIKRGEAIAANLAQSSKVAVFTENEFLLNSARKSVTGDTDFAYLLIYGEDWTILTDAEKRVTDVKRLIQELSDDEKDQLSRQRQGFFKHVTGNKGRFRASDGPHWQRTRRYRPGTAANYRHCETCPVAKKR